VLGVGKVSGSEITCLFKELRSRKDGLVRRRVRREIEKYLSRRAQENLAANPRKMAVFAQDLIGRSINLDGVFERRELDLLFSFLGPVLNDIAPGTCLDVGANIGNHTLYFSSRFANVVAFEPNPEVFQLLSFNVRGLETVSVQSVALGDGTHEALLREVDGNLGASSLKHQGLGSTVPVSVRRMDDFSYEKPVSFIKIDTEGFEAEVLRGADETLKTHEPIVVFEQLKSEFIGGSTPAIQLLQRLGYRICWIGWPGRSGAAGASKLVGKLIGALLGRRFGVYYGATVPARTHPMLIAVPQRFQGALGVA